MNVEQMVGLFTQGLFQEILVESQDIGIFVGEADGGTDVHVPQLGATLAGKLSAFVDGLTAAAMTSTKC